MDALDRFVTMDIAWILLDITRYHMDTVRISNGYWMGIGVDIGGI